MPPYQWNLILCAVCHVHACRLDVLAKNDEGLEKDSRQAYPSGHATYMFLSATVLSLWAMGKLRLFASPSQVGANVLVSGCCCCPWCGQGVCVKGLLGQG